MRNRLRAVWPAAKLVLGLAILVLIGRRFHEDLRRPDLWQRPVHFTWLILAGALYLAGLGCSAVYWRRLLRGLGERPGGWTIVRAYYIGHLGKYLPGKAWALFLRAGLARSGGVRLSVAVLTTLYEVLTTMAAGALLATLVFAWLAPSSGSVLDWEAMGRLARLQIPPGGILEKSAVVPLGLVLLAATGLPLLPVLFNRLAARLAARGQGETETQSLGAMPRLRHRWLLEGLALAGLGWLMLGASLAAVLYGLLGSQLHWTLASLGRLPAALALAYVSGFLIFVTPGGLGVREFMLTLLLAPELEQVAGLDPDAARSVAILAVVLLRLVWTAAELVMAGGLYLPMLCRARPSVELLPREVEGQRAPLGEEP